MNHVATEKIEIEAVVSNHASQTPSDPLSTEGYALVREDKFLQLFWQDRLDHFFGERIVEVRNALREDGWEGESRGSVLTRNNFQIAFDAIHVGAGANVVGGSWRLLATNNPKLSLALRTITKLPDVLAGTAIEFARGIELITIRETARIAANGCKCPQELTFKEFSEIAIAVKLEGNQGRQWSIEFSNQTLCFADGPSADGALRQAHSLAVNNSIYSNSPDAPDFMQKSVFPSENVLSEYPAVRSKFADVFVARDAVQRTQMIVETSGAETYPVVVSDLVVEGLFSGKVLAISVDGVVTQKVNRDGGTVRHALNLLSEPVVVGSVMDISYAGGVGVVGGQEVSVANER